MRMVKESSLHNRVVFKFINVLIHFLFFYFIYPDYLILFLKTLRLLINFFVFPYLTFKFQVGVRNRLGTSGLRRNQKVTRQISQR